jgi:hypothetical protein
MATPASLSALRAAASQTDQAPQPYDPMGLNDVLTSLDPSVAATSPAAYNMALEQQAWDKDTWNGNVAPAIGGPMGASNEIMYDALQNQNPGAKIGGIRYSGESGGSPNGLSLDNTGMTALQLAAAKRAYLGAGGQNLG